MNNHFDGAPDWANYLVQHDKNGRFYYYEGFCKWDKWVTVENTSSVALLSRDTDPLLWFNVKRRDAKPDLKERFEHLLKTDPDLCNLLLSKNGVQDVTQYLNPINVGDKVKVCSDSRGTQRYVIAIDGRHAWIKSSKDSVGDIIPLKNLVRINE